MAARHGAGSIPPTGNPEAVDSGTQHSAQRAPARSTRHSLGRRGLIAGAAALVAAAVAKQTAQPVAAAYNFQGDTTNTASASTVLNGAIGGQLFALTNTNVSSGAHALEAQASGGIAVQAASASNIGVDGSSNTTIGVRGQIASFSSTANTIAVLGNNPSAGVNPTGVYGLSDKGTGVFGQTNAANQYGVLGTTTAVNSTAISGIANQNGSSAFSGGTGNPNAFAAFFQGTVVVQGNFAVTGAKAAVIKHPKTNDYRLVYCVESPESWFEDAGEGNLTGGKGEVKFDPDFAALVHTDTYHVFLTALGDYHLHVTNRTAQGFTVQVTSGAGAAAQGTGAVSGSFSWRIMAKRADIAGARLAKFTMPNLPLPDVSKLPKKP